MNKNNMENKVIFEAVDQTDDELYYPLGLWMNLDAAVAEIKSASVGGLDEYDSACDGRFLVKIRRRKVDAIGDQGWPVYELEFTESINEDLDEIVWTCVERDEKAIRNG